MRDSQMFNILDNLSKVSETKQNLNESQGNHNVSTHTVVDANDDGILKKNNQATMRNILDGLNEALDDNQQKVNQMPADHEMADATKDGDHPASEHLVGEGVTKSNDDSNWGDEMIEDLKLLTQELEDFGAIQGIEQIISKYEQPAEPSDRDLENDWDAAMGDGKAEWDESAEPETVSEDGIEEDTIAGKETAHKPGLHSEKASFKDVFKSMDESDDDKESKLEQELHTEIKKNALTRNDKGTFNLNDDKIIEFLHTITEDNVDDKIDHLKQLMMHGDMGEDVKREVIRRLRELQAKKKQDSAPAEPKQAERDPNSFVDVPTHNLY